MSRTTTTRAVVIAAAAATLTAGALIGAGAGSSAAPDTEGASAGARGWPSSSVSARKVIRHARAAARDDGGSVVVVVEEPRRNRYVDVGAKGESPGDSFMWESALFTPGGARVGRDVVVCTLGIRTYLCNGTAQVAGRGKLQVTGAFFGDEAQIPITGGTGDFRDADGQLFAVNETETTTTLVFQFADD